MFNSFVLQGYKNIKAYRRRYTELEQLVWQYNKTKSILFVFPSGAKYHRKDSSALQTSWRTAGTISMVWWS